MTTTIKQVFNTKLTENGDLSFEKVSENEMLNILFLTEFYQKNLSGVPTLGTSEKEKLFARFIRDPRLGLGRRDLGRHLMKMTGCSIDQVMKSGRADDLLAVFELTDEVLDFLKKEIENDNQLVKKWMPRYSSKNLLLARQIAKKWNLNKQQYGKFIKVDTTEQHLSRKEGNRIIFNQVPSLAMLKYASAFARREDTKENYQGYLQDLKEGKASINLSTSTVYDIYKNRHKLQEIDAVVRDFPKININCIPIIDTSGSMSCDDAIGKALSIGHYLSKCSSFMNGHVITFSSRPTLIQLGTFNNVNHLGLQKCPKNASLYEKELYSMITGDFSNTDLGKVMELLQKVEELPEFLVILSDMEFDYGSSMRKDTLLRLWREKGYSTKIVWWNLNSRSATCPEMDNNGNIFLSGYNPTLLKFLEAGFDGHQFLQTLLKEYETALQE